MYIVDFFAPAGWLVVEVDGGFIRHVVRGTRGGTRVLARLGYRVLRLDAELVRRNISQAVALIAAALRAV